MWNPMKDMEHSKNAQIFNTRTREFAEKTQYGKTTIRKWKIFYYEWKKL